MPTGYWELNFIPAEPDDALRAKAMLIKELHDVRGSSPDKYKELLLCIRASSSARILEKLDRIPTEKLHPRRNRCQRCDGIIEYDDVSEPDWNLEAIEQGFCSALCLEYRSDESTTTEKLLIELTGKVADWLSEQSEYDAFDFIWDESRQSMVLKFMRNVVRS